MKQYNFCIIFLFAVFHLNGQTASFISSNGGSYKPAPSQCLPSSERAVAEAKTAANVALLQAQGKLPTANEKQIVLFEWPLRQAAGFNYNSYYGISNYVDHNTNVPNQLEDWNCGVRSYDLADGYNHQGIDIFTWPYSWCMMDDNQVEVIAAAAGTIIYKDDGNFDRNCGFGNDPANAIIVQHADGSRAWYWHMKNGSVTSKNVGNTVAAGEYLGVVASSGSSTGPHLHFEVDLGSPSFALIDPYAGPCNSLNTSSWWLSQKPYREPTINTIMTHDAEPIFNACPQPETKNISDCFEGGDLAYFAVYLHDQQINELLEIRIYRPDGTLYVSNSLNSPSTYSASWWWWSYFLPNSSYGTWRFEATTVGQTVTHYFELSENCTPVEIQASALLQGPLSGGLMDTDLYAAGMVPLIDSYGLGESVTSMPSNIVDWVKLELRDPANPAIIMGTRACLLRNDGAIIDPKDGSTSVKFLGITTTSGYVAVRHRNHLGIMTNNAVTF